MNKLASHTLFSLLKLKGKLQNGKSESAEKDKVLMWKGLDFKKVNSMKSMPYDGQGFIIHDLNNLPEDSNVIFNGLENYLILAG